MNENKYRTGRIMHIFQATFEYLVSILVVGSFLATITKELGISDSLTGIISSFISLGCVFQLLSVLVRRKRVKGFVVVCSVVNQLLFMLLYIVPLSGAAKPIRIVLFVVAIFIAYLVYNIAHPKKMNWFMSLVDDNRRGSYTAKKEMVSLIAGVVFSYGMGALIDSYKEKGDIRTAFILCGSTIFVLMVLHTITMIVSVEKVAGGEIDKNPLRGMKNILKDKTVLQVTVVLLIWQIAQGAAVPFYGTFQINELGFSLTFVSVLAIVSSSARVLVARFLGGYADRATYAKMLRLCYGIAAASFLVNVFATQSNGKYIFIIHYILYGISMAGINSAPINLVFDYVVPEKRADSMAISQAMSGLVGFLSTLCFSALISVVQQNGNQFLGIPVYAQQITSLIAGVLAVSAMFYVHFVLMKTKKI